MTATRSFAFVSLRFAGWTALLGTLALAACGPTPPEKMVIAPATAGTATGFAVLRKEAQEGQPAPAEVRFEPKVSYAFIDSDWPEYYTVALLEKPLDNQKLAEASDPGDLVEDAMRNGANGVMMYVDGDGDLSVSFRMRAGDQDVQFGGGGGGSQVRGLTRTGDKLTGHLYYFDTALGDRIAIDSAFDTQLVLPPKGTPLPADGGDAGEAYLETVEAMRSGDLDKILAVMPPEQAKQVAANKDKKEDLAQMLEFMKAMTPEQVEVTGGTSYGERVVLNTRGTSDKQPFTGTVEMKWEEGGWRKGKTSDRVGSSSTENKDEAPKAPHADDPPKADFVPVMVDDGIAGKGFRNDAGEFAPTHAFVVTMPAEFGENRMLFVLSGAELDPKNAKATWDDDTPLEKLYADGKAHPALWLNLSRDEAGDISADKVYFVDEEGGADDAYMSFEAIEVGGKLVGTLSQQMQINDDKCEGFARFNLPILPAP